MIKKAVSVSRKSTIHVKTAKKRSVISNAWLKRQLNDEYVIAANRDGYFSRAAYKLIEIDDKEKFLKKGMVAVDLGAAPGGFSQVLAKRCLKFSKSGELIDGLVIAIDLLEIKEIKGVVSILGDFLDEANINKIFDILQEKYGEEKKVDIVVSDMAANTTGHSDVDHIRIVYLVEMAILFAKKTLKKGGVFVSKVFQGGLDSSLLKDLKLHFKEVKHIKPPASRKESKEIYVIAKGFKGNV